MRKLFHSTIPFEPPFEPGRKFKINSLKRHYLYWCYLFIFPQVVMYIVFTLWPVLGNFYYSLFDWDGIGAPTKYIGLANFKEIVTESFFWNAFKNSFIYTLGVVVIGVPLSLLVALALNYPKLKGAVFYRTLFFLPVVLTMAIVGLVMNHIFAFDSGFVNEILMKFHLIKKPVNWLGNNGTAMAALIVVGCWKGFGIKVIYWLAGLQTLPREIYEASKIDGASTWQQFVYITVPLLFPFFIVITFFQTVWSFNVFDLVKTFTGGGPYFGTDVVPLYIYRYAFEIEGGFPRMGYAAAAGILYGVVVIAICAGLVFFVRKFGGKKSFH